METVSRLLVCPKRSFFLFGPRGVGKSTWLKKELHRAVYFNLLDTRLYLELSRAPSLLEAKVGDKPADTWVCVDEVQKIPDLLNEVHRLMESKRWKFALSGSSARKLRRGGVNLLAGRAITREMAPFSYGELGNKFPLRQVLEWGLLPLVVLHPHDAPDTLTAYVHTYLKEEIKEEGLVRKVEPFVRFLEIAGLMNGQQINSENIARDAHIPRSTVDVYFSILEDTLLGYFLKPYRPGAKVREQAHRKFYWFDAGVARGAANLLYDPLEPGWLGYALETMIFHEMRVHNHVRGKNRPFYYYRVGGIEIDFVIETRKRTMSQKPEVICLEVKGSKKWDRKWEKPIRSLKETGRISVKKMVGVYLGEESFHFNGFDVLPALEFLTLLHEGKIF